MPIFRSRNCSAHFIISNLKKLNYSPFPVHFLLFCCISLLLWTLVNSPTCFFCSYTHQWFTKATCALPKQKNTINFQSHFMHFKNCTDTTVILTTLPHTLYIRGAWRTATSAEQCFCVLQCSKHIPLRCVRTQEVYILFHCDLFHVYVEISASFRLQANQCCFFPSMLLLAASFPSDAIFISFFVIYSRVLGHWTSGK